VCPRRVFFVRCVRACLCVRACVVSVVWFVDVVVLTVVFGFLFLKKKSWLCVCSCVCVGIDRRSSITVVLIDCQIILNRLVSR
jgi:hypothetical protein